MISVLLADDNAVIRRGLAALLNVCDGIEVVGEAGNGAEAIAMAETTRPDVVLLDVRMPAMDGVTAATTLSQASRVLMLTYTDDPETVAAALRNGASGYLVYGRFEPEELERAVRAIAEGHTVLSPVAADVVYEAFVRGQDRAVSKGRPGVRTLLSDRECEVMTLIARGRSNSEIGTELFVSEKTVKNHVNRIYAKVGARSRSEAIATWLGLSDATS